MNDFEESVDLLFKQIVSNPYVSLCFSNYQIEGISEIIGHPSLNHLFIEQMKTYYFNSYKAYSHLENERLIKIKPTFIKKWIYEGSEAFEEIYDFKEKTYQKRKYIGI